MNLMEDIFYSLLSRTEPQSYSIFLTFLSGCPVLNFSILDPTVQTVINLPINIITEYISSRTINMLGLFVCTFKCLIEIKIVAIYIF